MSKNTNLSFLTDFITADIVNSRVGINNASPQTTFDVTGTGKFSGILTLGSTISNGTYAYTLPSATGTLALTSDIPSVTGYVPYTGATQAVNLGYNSLSASFLRIDGAGPTLGSYLGFKHSTNVTTGADGYTSIYTFGTNTIAFKSVSGATTRDFSFSMASITPGVPGGRTYTLPDADGTIALTSNIPANPVGGTGTSGTIPVFTGSTTIGNSIIQSNATQVNVVGNGSALLFDSLGSTKNGGIQYIDDFVLNVYNSRGTGSAIQLGNNNIDLITDDTTRLTILDTGEVGIGTDTPNTKLQIDDSSDVILKLRRTVNSGSGIQFESTGVNTSRLYGASDSHALRYFYNSNEYLRISATANLLIQNGGTFTDNGARLQVSGTATIGSGTQGINDDADLTLREGVAFVGLDFKSARTSGNIGGLRFYNTSSDFVPIAQQLTETDGKFVFRNGTSGSETRLTITSGGNVLIGDSTDNGARLQVSGVSASSALSLRNTTGGTLADFIITENSGLIVNSYEGASARSIDFRLANTSALLIASTGAATFNLGSGEMRLNRTGTSEFLKLNTYYLLSDGNDQLLGSVTGATSIYAGNGVSPRLTITSSGLVGIGTASPGQLLTLGGTASPQLSIISSTTTGSSEIYFGDSGAVYRGFLGYQHNGDFMQFATAATERMRITSSGNVGIGTNNPARQFVVSNGGANGLEITSVSSGTIMEIISYNRSTSAYTPLQFQSSVYNFNQGNVLIGTTSDSGSRLRISGGNLQIDGGFQKMYTYYIIVQPNTTGTVTISSPIGTNMQGSMQVMAGGYGNSLSGNVTGLWMVGGLLFFNNASTSTITQIVNSVTANGSMSFQRSSDQYTVTLANTSSTQTKTFYVSVIINGT